MKNVHLLGFISLDFAPVGILEELDSGDSDFEQLKVEFGLFSEFFKVNLGCGAIRVYWELGTAFAYALEGAFFDGEWARFDQRIYIG